MFSNQRGYNKYHLLGRQRIVDESLNPMHSAEHFPALSSALFNTNQ